LAFEMKKDENVLWHLKTEENVQVTNRHDWRLFECQGKQPFSRNPPTSAKKNSEKLQEESREIKTSCSVQISQNQKIPLSKKSSKLLTP